MWAQRVREVGPDSTGLAACLWPGRWQVSPSLWPGKSKALLAAHGMGWLAAPAMGWLAAPATLGGRQDKQRAQTPRRPRVRVARAGALGCARLLASRLSGDLELAGCPNRNGLLIQPGHLTEQAGMIRKRL